MHFKLLQEFEISLISFNFMFNNHFLLKIVAYGLSSYLAQYVQASGMNTLNFLLATTRPRGYQIEVLGKRIENKATDGVCVKL